MILKTFYCESKVSLCMYSWLTCNIWWSLQPEDFLTIVCSPTIKLYVSCLSYSSKDLLKKNEIVMVFT